MATLLTLCTGLYAWSEASPAVLVLALTPLFAVLALASGLAARTATPKQSGK